MIKAFCQSDTGVKRIDVVIGCGLVGEALCRAICRRPVHATATPAQSETDWSDPTHLASQLEEVGAGIHTLAVSREDLEIHFFWCAGRAGFGSSETDTENELENYRLVLRWAEDCRSNGSTFHLVSSAGGLHEGQTRCDDPSQLERSRPYARLKLEQERLLTESKFERKVIYRLSSVYGIAKPGQRFGLIPTIIRNGLAHRSTTIFANANTQRDFVSADDIATFMANEAPCDSELPIPSKTAPTYHYLVSGVPCTIWSIHVDLQRLLGKNIRVTYTTHKDNFQSTTFSPALTPKHWKPQSVKQHLPLLCQRILGKPRR